MKMIDLSISSKEKQYLRDLAKKQLEYSMLPIMREREERWYKHNDLQGDIPMIHFETWTCEQDLLPPLQCESQAARDIELQLYRAVVNHEMIDDDRVVPSWYTIYWRTRFELFNLKVEREHSKDSSGREVGHKFLHPIKDLKEDLHLLKPTMYQLDREGTLKWKSFVEDIIGDILPVKVLMPPPGICLTQNVVHLMGMENMFYSMFDYPDEFHQFMQRIIEDHIGFLRWMEKEELTSLNNGNQHVPQGTFGFTKDLPRDGYTGEGSVSPSHIWGYLDSQETVGVSPEMFGEFFYPYYLEGAKQYGLVNYGCCEPVHTIWEDYISKLPNLRKVSISPWCDEEYMGEALKGSNVIYHRKPSPNFVGVGKELDEEGFKEHILKTIRCAKGCKLEFSFRDVYNLEGNPDKPRRAVQIVRELIDKEWK